MLIENRNKDIAVFIADFVAIVCSYGFLKYNMVDISDGIKDKIVIK